MRIVYRGGRGRFLLRELYEKACGQLGGFRRLNAREEVALVDSTLLLRAARLLERTTGDLQPHVRDALDDAAHTCRQVAITISWGGYL